MSPTLVSLGLRAHNAITVGFLSLWVTVALGFAALDFVAFDWSFVNPMLSLSLLTYLICRLIAVFQNKSSDGGMVYFLTTAHRRSRRQALAVLLFTCGWIYEIILKILFMFVATLLSGSLLLYHHAGMKTLDDLETLDSKNPKSDLQLKEEHMAQEKAKIDDFFKEVGFDPVEFLGWVPPKIMVFCIVLAWFGFGTLAFYIFRLAWLSLKRVFKLPTPEYGPEKQHVA